MFATDLAGNSTALTYTYEVYEPITGEPVVTTTARLGASIGTKVTIKGSFTDVLPGTGPYLIRLDPGDGTGFQKAAKKAAAGTFTRPVTYTSAGIFLATVEVCDATNRCGRSVTRIAVPLDAALVRTYCIKPPTAARPYALASVSITNPNDYDVFVARGPFNAIVGSLTKPRTKFVPGTKNFTVKFDVAGTPITWSLLGDSLLMDTGGARC